jgi:hypothetical protein
MTTAWKELPDQDERAQSASVGPDENQLEMFETAPLGDAQSPRMVDGARSSDRREGDVPQRTDMTVTGGSPLRFLDVSGADPDELRRLEESIRWLMNESSVRQLPRAPTLPPVRGLPPVEVSEGADSLLLNPERLFPPRSTHRRGGIARGVAKFLLASVVAAPTAYVVANWLQRVDTAAPSSAVSVVGSLQDRVAAVAPTPKPQQPPPYERARPADEVSSAPPPEPMATRAIPPIEARPVIATQANPVDAAAAPERVPSVPTALPDPEPRATPMAISAPSAAPPKPVLSAQDIAEMVERGRILFDSGDVAAARLFFRRAASAGNAAAALAMGATYDPDVLAKRFVRGIGADPEAARMWYEKARELGSPEGPRRIEMLAHR